MTDLSTGTTPAHEQAEAYARGEIEPMPAQAAHHADHEEHSKLVDMAMGAVAGALGVWAMDKVGSFMYDQEDASALEREHRARVHGKDPAHAALDKVADVTGASIPTEQPSRAGIGIHYGLGVGPGALYGVARHEVPQLRAGGGALYGLGLFLAQDEVMAPLLGIAGPPGEYPWQAHFRGLVSHVTLGVVTETVLTLFDRAR